VYFKADYFLKVHRARSAHSRRTHTQLPLCWTWSTMGWIY